MCHIWTGKDYDDAPTKEGNRLHCSRVFDHTLLLCRYGGEERYTPTETELGVLSICIHGKHYHLLLCYAYQSPVHH